MEENRKEGSVDTEKLTSLIEKAFLTKGGRKLAKSVLLQQEKTNQPVA